MAISITPSPFGSVTVTLDGELGGVLSVGVLATSNSALNMDLGVPGPQGEAGEPGQNGSNGQGVAAGGLTNQVLVKLSNDNFDTGWADGGAAGDFLPLPGGTMSGAILFDAVGGQNIAKGSFDSGRGGYNGISLNCANLYELNWQSGYLKNIYNNAVAPINVESDFIFPVDVNGNDSAIGPWGFGVENIDAGQSASIEPNQIAITTDGVGTAITSSGVTFPDTTVQVTAGLPLTGGTMTGDIVYTETGGFGNVRYTNQGVRFDGGDYFFSPEDGLTTQAVNAEFVNVYGSNVTMSALGIGLNAESVLTFPDSSVQTTAFPPTGGLVTEYIMHRNTRYLPRRR